MKLGLAFRIGLQAILLLGSVLSLPMTPPSATALTAPRSLLFAHYMPWFEAKPFGNVWGWHWTMNHFDPEQQKDGRREIASHLYPLIGPYDSADPAVIEYHLLLMKLAGIDGIIVDWYGLSDLYDYPIIHRNTTALIQAAGKLGLQVAICYEDQTITRLVEAKKLTNSKRVAHARAEMDWLRDNWFKDKSYLKFKGKPVLLSFGLDGLNDSEWSQVFTSTQTSPVYLSEHRKRSAAAGAFDWPVPQQGLGALDTFYRDAKYWSVSMPVVFPRFQDIYKEAGVNAGYGEIADNRGRTFTTTLARALNSGAPFIQLATWNDWGEGTVIEPSAEFGYRDLEVILRQHASAVSGDAVTADDLRLPERLYTLRQTHRNQPATLRELDRAAQLLASRTASSIKAARAILSTLETNP